MSFTIPDFGPSDLMTSPVENSRRLKVSSLTSNSGGGMSAFGETMTASNMPAIQISAQYGITNKILTSTIGGATYSQDSLFIAETGAFAGSISALVSERQIPYKAGQGLRGVFSAVFSEGVEGCSQQAGLLNSELAFSFGFNGTDFGVVYGEGGLQEIQELQITSGATSDETAIVTIDDVIHNIPITDSDAETNAYEIAVYIQENDPRYTSRSISDIAEVLGNLPELGGGTFSFSSPTAVGVFTEIQASNLANEIWINKSDWNVNPDINIDPTLGNVYMVQFGYTGFDGVNFYVKNPDTNVFELVHILKYGNSSVTPIVKNPIFRIGWGVRNTTNDTVVTVKGGSAAAFNEGERVYDAHPQGITNTQNISANGNDYNILTIRNGIIFNDKVNRSDSLTIDLDLTTEASKITTFKIIENPIFATGDALKFEYTEEGTSLIEKAVNNVEVIGGHVQAVHTTLTSKTIDLFKLLDHLSPGESITITASIPSGQSADTSASINMKDDL